MHIKNENALCSGTRLNYFCAVRYCPENMNTEKFLVLIQESPDFAGADYERLRILSHKAHTIQYKIASKSNGILFVHSAEDIGLIYFSPKEEYNVHVDDEEPSLMYCIIDRV